MSRDSDDLEVTPTDTGSLSRRIGGLAANVAAYTLFGLGVLCLYTFFAPFIGTPTIGLVNGILPTIAAPTEANGVVVNASPLIAGIVAMFAGVWLR